MRQYLGPEYEAVPGTRVRGSTWNQNMKQSLGSCIGFIFLLFVNEVEAPHILDLRAQFLDLAARLQQKTVVLHRAIPRALQ